VTSAEVTHLLRECDLVKFARHVPSHEESDQILEVAFTIVKRSSPAGQKSAEAKKASKVESTEAESATDASEKPAKSAKSADEPEGESRLVEHEEKRG
jgi:hypothetical protein